MKKLTIALFAFALLATSANADGNCGGSFQIIQQQAFVPVQRNIIVQQQFVPAFALVPVFQRSFNLQINRGFAFAPAPVVAAPFRSFNLSINRGFAVAPRGAFFGPRFR